jgi:hypothetical protein
MNQLITLILLALLGGHPGQQPPPPRAPAPFDIERVGVDETQLEEGFDVDEFDFAPMDERLLNKKMGEGDLTNAIEKLKAIAQVRRAKVMAPVRRPRRLMPAEGTYGDEVVYDLYGRANRRR